MPIKSANKKAQPMEHNHEPTKNTEPEEKKYSTSDKGPAHEKISPRQNLFVSPTRAKEIEKGLKSIYKDSSGKIPDMSNLEFNHRSKLATIITLIIVALAVILSVAWLGFMAFNPTPSYQEDRVNLEIKGPFSAKSGANVDYIIKLTNAGNTSLSNTNLTVFLPIGFIFSNASPAPVKPEAPLTDTNNNLNIAALTPESTNVKSWKINDLFPNASKEIEISGQLIGQQGSKQIISAVLNYIPANFSSTFEKKISFTSEISDSSLGIELNYPKQMADQEEGVIILNLQNTSEQIDIKALEVEFNYPPDFTLTSSQILDNANSNLTKPVLETPTKEGDNKPGQKIWTFDNLFFSTQRQITIKGKFKVSASQKKILNLKIKIKGPAGTDYVQKDEDLEIEVIKGELMTSLIIQGSNENKPVNFGDQLSYLISIENKSNNTLGDIKIRTVLDSPLLNWASLTNDRGGIREGNQILWTKEQIPDLALFLPGSEVEITFQIKLAEFDSNKHYKTEDLKVKSFFEAQINAVNNKEAALVNTSGTVINEINTNLQLTVTGNYFASDNSTLGSGPLPPIVGQKTSYRLTWKLNNSLNEISNILVKTKLPSYVNYEGQAKTSTGDLTANQNNEVIWTISRIPNSVNQVTAEFDVSIRPTSQDVDKILSLLSEVIATATDSVTKGLISKSALGVTTNLDADPLAKGKGLVQSE